MDSDDPDSHSTYMFQDGYDWDPTPQEVIPRLEFTQEEFDLMVDTPLDMEALDAILDGKEENPDSLSCAPAQCAGQPSITEPASAALNTTTQLTSRVRLPGPIMQKLDKIGPSIPLVVEPHLEDGMFSQSAFPEEPMPVDPIGNIPAELIPVQEIPVATTPSKSSNHASPVVFDSPNTSRLKSHLENGIFSQITTPEQAMPVSSIGNIQAEPSSVQSTPVRTTPVKPSNNTSPSTFSSPNKSVYDDLKSNLVRVAERVKLNPRVPVPRNLPPELTKVPPSTPVKRPVSVLKTLNLSALSTLMKKRPRASSTLTTPVKSQKLTSPPNTDPGKSTPRGGQAYTYPDSWETATGEDILLFDLKDRNYSWSEITDTFRQLTPREYARTTLQNRYNKIRSRIGEIPKSLLAIEAMKDEARALAENL